MEFLQELERVQTTISSMQSVGVSSGDPDSDRFLAQFLLFMVQPCGSVNMQKRFQLVSHHLHKISVMVFDEEMFLVNQDRQRNCDVSTSQSYPEDNLDLHLTETKVPDMATIGLDAMKRANSTLEDFCRSYFMFHGMDVNKPQSIFKFLPVLFFTESYIYQLDIMNEKLSKDMISSNNCANDALHESSCSRPDLFGPLIFLLHNHGLLTERIKAELEFGSEYWALERKLCHALTSKRKILIEDVMQAIHLKSFDYRVLNLLLYHLREEQVNELHMEFLSISEFLVEVSDDLYDYEEDVVENSFNILRMFVRVYGASDAPNKLAKCIGEAEEKYERLSKTLEPDLSLNYWRRCEEATKEGGTSSGHSFGTWSIPSVIVDEELYRSGVINLKQS